MCEVFKSPVLVFFGEFKTVIPVICVIYWCARGREVVINFDIGSYRIFDSSLFDGVAEKFQR